MKNRKYLFFAGIKHSGKTTFAKAISKDLQYSFFDSDELIIVRLNGLGVRDFYRKNGKEAFMDLEEKSIRDFLENNKEPFILALGGGASDNTPLMELIKEKGYIIYLKREEKDMLPIILEHGIPAFLDKNNLEGSFHELYARRDRIYIAYADLTIELGPYKDKDECKKYILSKLKENRYGI